MLTVKPACPTIKYALIDLYGKENVTVARLSLQVKADPSEAADLLDLLKGLGFDDRFKATIRVEG